MNMEQINMMMQLMMQQGQVSTSGAGKDSNGDSFQDMMSQKQDEVSSNKPTSNDKQTQSKPTQNDKVQQTEQTPQEEVPEVSDDVRQALVALLLQPYAVQDVAMQQPVQENVDVVSAMPTVDTVVTQTVQTVVAAETAAPVVQQETAQPVAVQVPQQTATVEQGQTAPEVVMPQENVQQQGMQNTATQTEQQSTGEATTGQKMVEVEQQPDDQPVVVTEQEQPLFRDVETVPVKVGDATPTVDVKAPDMEKQLADTIQANLNNVGDKVQIQLQPENLGHITIELVQHGGKMGLVIFADNAKTTSLLAQHAGNLGALLEDRTGQTVHVQVQQQEPEQQQYDGHNQQNRQQQEQQQSHSQQSKAEQDSFLGQLRLGLYQLDVV
nr:flagellar hook-length control protein FliK [uncultured Agathobaculum sp.]